MLRISVIGSDIRDIVFCSFKVKTKQDKETTITKYPTGLGDRPDLKSQLCCLSVV